MRAYEMRHVVGFEETNLVGNVYYVNYLRWQGRCREMFLRDHCPDVLGELQRDLAMVTLRCSCEYLGELVAFDVVAVRMQLAEMVQNRVTMRFEYFRVTDGVESLSARGEQAIACMRRGPTGLTPCPVPETMREALRGYQ